MQGALLTTLVPSKQNKVWSFYGNWNVTLIIDTIYVCMCLYSFFPTFTDCSPP